MYLNNNKPKRSYFINPKATVPLTEKNSNLIKEMPWGRRPQQSGQLPMGGWVEYEHLSKGRYDRFFPRTVKLNVFAYLTHACDGRELWVDVLEAQWVQAVILREGQEQRAYVITIPVSQQMRKPKIEW